MRTSVTPYFAQGARLSIVSKKLELNPDDYVDNPDAVVDILVEHKQLLQRPLIVKGSKAIIGRPKDRIAPFIS